MRVAVVGVGGVGAMASWRLAKSGHSVIALEQYHLDHDRGSSYGDSRIVRRVYPDSLYTGLMADAYSLWDELQARFPETELFRRTGGIFFGKADRAEVIGAQEALARAAVPYEVISPENARRRFPAFAFRDEETVVCEPSMGYARASHCVRAAVRLARQYGADIREETPVSRILRAGEGIEVVTAAGERIHAERLLVTAGPWIGQLAARLGLKLPLTVTRQPYIHLEPRQNAADFEVGRFPVWIDAEANAYGFPRLGELSGVKIGIHDHGATTTPETVDRQVNEEDREAIRRYAAARFPDLETTSTTDLYAKVCLYTNTPDTDFLVDRVPGLEGAFLVAGLSGHGFKFTPLLGQIAADLAAGTRPPYDLRRFALARFDADR